jgi:hypothetical protein
MRRALAALLLLPLAFAAGLAAADPALAAPPAPSFSAPTYGATVHTTTPGLSGTGQHGDTVIVSEMGIVVCTATVSAAGTWRCVPAAPLLNGLHLLHAQQTDRLGQASTGSDVLQIVVKVAGQPTPPRVAPSPRPRSTAPVTTSPASAGQASSDGASWVVPLAIAAIVALAVIIGLVLWARMRPRRR